MPVRMDAPNAAPQDRTAATGGDRSEAKVGQQGWPPFVPGLWSRTIDVCDFIQQNVTPYYEDESFLAGPT